MLNPITMGNNIVDLIKVLPDIVFEDEAKAREIWITTSEAIVDHIQPGVTEVVGVANIANPAAELAGIEGTVEGFLLTAYQAGVGASNKNTHYVWDPSAGATNVPFVVAGAAGGKWVAAGGRYNNSEFDVPYTSLRIENDIYAVGLPVSGIHSLKGNRSIACGLGDLGAGVMEPFILARREDTGDAYFYLMGPAVAAAAGIHVFGVEDGLGNELLKLMTDYPGLTGAANMTLGGGGTRGRLGIGTDYNANKSISTYLLSTADADIRGLEFTVVSNPVGAKAQPTYGMIGFAQHNGTQLHTGNLIGAVPYAFHNGTNTVSTMLATQAVLTIANTGACTTGACFNSYGSMTGGGNITTLFHYQATQFTRTSGSVGTMVGINIPDLTAAWVTTAWGLRCDTDSILLNDTALGFRTLADQAIWSSAASTLDLKAATTMNFRIGASIEAAITATQFDFKSNQLKDPSFIDATAVSDFRGVISVEIGGSVGYVPVYDTYTP